MPVLSTIAAACARAWGWGAQASLGDVALGLQEMAKLGSNAHMWLPGVGGFSGMDLGNYTLSTSSDPALVDGPVGLVFDMAGGAPALGANLLTNSGPFANTSGWSANNSGVVGVSGGLLTVSNPSATYGGAIASFPTVAGKRYVVEYRAQRTAGALSWLLIGDVAGGFSFATINLPATMPGDPLEWTFVANGPTTYLTFQNNNQSNHALAVASVTVKEVLGLPATQATAGNRPVLRRGLRNLQLQSETLANQWTPNGTATPTNNAATDQDGVLAASTLVCAAGVGNGVYWSTANGIASSTPCTQAAIVKRTAGTSIRMQLGWDTSGGWIKVNPQTMALVTQGANVTAVSSLQLGNGYTLFAWNFSVPVANPAFVYYNDDAGGLTLAVAGTGLFVGTYTAAQIAACGGIPLTTTSPASSSLGNWAWEFDGTDDRLSLSGLPFFSSNDHAVIVGCRRDTPTGTYTGIYGSGGGGAQKSCHLGVTNAGMPYAQWQDDAATNAGIIGTTPKIGIPFVLSGRKVGTTYDARVDGLSIGSLTATIGTTTLVNPNIGTVAAASGEFLRGAVYPVVVIRDTVSDTVLSRLEKMVAALTGPTGVTFPVVYSANYLVVAGGGGGGKSDSGFSSDSSGGGGAGGMRTGSAFLVKGQTYAITVGAGGLGGVKVTSQATNGGDSSIGSLIVATGGGAGGGIGSGSNGGSGGGNGATGAGGTGIAGQGYAGGTVAGGGGAGGGAGGAGSGFTPGPGAASSITGTSVTYATGGYGTQSAPAARNPNTGDGGYGGLNSNGGAGGSGVVVIQYANTLPVPASITGTYTDISASTPGFRTYRFTGNGSITL